MILVTRTSKESSGDHHPPFLGLERSIQISNTDNATARLLYENRRRRRQKPEYGGSTADKEEHTRKWDADGPVRVQRTVMGTG